MLSQDNTTTPLPLLDTKIIQHAHAKGFRGEGVKIGIISTGYRVMHEDLEVDLKDFGYSSHYPYPIEVGDLTLLRDDLGTGTQLVSVLGSQFNLTGVLGAAPSAEYYILKSTPSSQNVGTAVKWLTSRNVDVICISPWTNYAIVGGIYDFLIKDAVLTAIHNGISVVIAAGPWQREFGTIGALGLEHDGQQWVPRTDGERVGSVFAVPGVMMTATNETNYSYGIADREVVSVGVLTGMVALIKQRFPHASQHQVVEFMNGHVRPIGEGGSARNGKGFMALPDLSLEYPNFGAPYVRPRHGMYLNGVPIRNVNPGTIIERVRNTFDEVLEGRY